MAALRGGAVSYERGTHVGCPELASLPRGSLPDTLETLDVRRNRLSSLQEVTQPPVLFVVCASGSTPGQRRNFHFF